MPRPCEAGVDVRINHTPVDSIRTQGSQHTKTPRRWNVQSAGHTRVNMERLTTHAAEALHSFAATVLGRAACLQVPSEEESRLVVQLTTLTLRQIAYRRRRLLLCIALRCSYLSSPR